MSYRLRMFAHRPLRLTVLAAAPLSALALALPATTTASAGDQAPAGAAPMTATAAKVKCPIKASGSSAAPVQWAFTESAPPSGAHKGISSSYTHGRGRWQSGKATGTVCHEDALTAGKGSHDLVLSVAGAAKLSPHVKRLGLLGVELALKVKITASDDTSCPIGSAGIVTLFASYYGTHKDTLALSFQGGCEDHDHRYGGGSLHVLITRGGAQVNSA